MWYLQFHFVCDRLFTSFISMTSLCFFVQLADRTLILSKGSFSVYIIATRLLLNHSPSEWFSYTKKGAYFSGAFRLCSNRWLSSRASGGNLHTALS